MQRVKGTKQRDYVIKQGSRTNEKAWDQNREGVFNQRGESAFFPHTQEGHGAGFRGS